MDKKKSSMAEFELDFSGNFRAPGRSAKWWSVYLPQDLAQLACQFVDLKWLLDEVNSLRR